METHFMKHKKYDSEKLPKWPFALKLEYNNGQTILVNLQEIFGVRVLENS